MAVPAFDLELQLQRHGSALRQLAGELVRDPHEADDAVQEVWLAALRRPPGHERALGGWLATALHNAVRMLKRGARRRALHETEAAAARGLFAEDAAAGPAREEVAAGLLAAVRALEQPYRDAIWERWFEGKPPRAIAAASGVPLATVKSRLQRGLGMLRAQLGERDAERGTDWRAALVGAFALEKETAAATGAGAGAAAAVIGGGVAMGVGAKVAVCVALAVGVAFVGLAGRAREPVAPAVIGARAANEVAPVGVGSREQRSLPDAAGVPRVAGAVDSASADARLAKVRGRCVDETGRPLAGVLAALRGGERSSETTAAWLVEHDRLDWQDPPAITTSADGVFEFAAAPQPPLQFFLALEVPGRVPASAEWSALRPAQVVDLGDVQMPLGVTVGGRVVDKLGRPRPGLYVDFVAKKKSPRHAGASTRDETRGYTADDGSFASFSPALPGEYEVRVDQLVVTVGVAQGMAPLLLVTDDTTPPASIRGRVVDAADRPVANALVDAAFASSVRSGSDGRFTLEPRHGDDTEAAFVRASSEGFDPAVARNVPWKTEDLLLRLTPSPSLTVTVVNGEAGPVERFAVRLLPTDLELPQSSQRLRAHGHHALGVATIPGVARGDYDLVVEFSESAALPPLVTRVGIHADTRVNLNAAAAACSVRVRREDGTPIVGSRVQLCQEPHSGWDDAVQSMPLEAWLQHRGGRVALVLGEAVTDGDGRAELAGRTGGALTLRLLGPGHVPTDVTGVVPGAEREVVVAAGASIRGRIVPAAALAELDRIRRNAADTPLGERAVTMCLRQGRRLVPDAPHQLFGDLSFGSIRADGTFSVHHVPAGSWEVGVKTIDFGPASAAPRIGQNCVTYAATAALRDSEVAELELDLSSIIPTRLVGIVFVNGELARNAAVQLDAHRGASASEEVSTTFLRTDADGRFHHVGPGGAFDLWVTVPPQQPGSSRRLRAAGRVVAASGTTVEHTFSVVSGSLELVVRRADGAPATGVRVSIVDPPAQLGPSDAAGRIRAEVTAGPAVLRVLPRRLQSPAAYREFHRAAMRERRADPLAEQWLPIGTTTVVSGASTTYEIVLPPEWER